MNNELTKGIIAALVVFALGFGTSKFGCPPREVSRDTVTVTRVDTITQVIRIPSRTITVHEILEKGSDDLIPINQLFGCDTLSGTITRVDGKWESHLTLSTCAVDTTFKYVEKTIEKTITVEKVSATAGSFWRDVKLVGSTVAVTVAAISIYLYSQKKL